MGRVKIYIPKDALELLYWKDCLSPSKIGKIYNCDCVTVRTRMREYGIPKRSPSESRMRYKKFDFSGDPVEKAYMIGFRLGDLNVYQTSKKSSLIMVRCNTTQMVQVRLIEKMFSKYGKVTISKGPHYRNIHCCLNKSFDFLIPKKQEIPAWIEDDDKTAAAFIAGYTDAEGNFLLNQGRARFKIDSYDLKVLTWIVNKLTQKGVLVKFSCIAKEGQFYTLAYKYNGDLWRMSINEAISLLNFIRYIKPFTKHQTRLNQMIICEENILHRIKRGSVKYAT